MFSSVAELWELGDRNSLWEQWDAGMWTTRSFLAWVGFSVLPCLGRTEPAPLGGLPMDIVGIAPSAAPNNCLNI